MNNLILTQNIPKEKPVIEKKLNERLKNSEIKTIDELLKVIPNKDNMALEDIFLIVYCVVSDFINLVGGQKSLRASNNNDPSFTDAEIITVALVAELFGQKSQNGWVRFVRKNYLSLFPRLCSRSRYCRRLLFLHKIICFFQMHLCSLMNASYSKYLIIDSFPLEICCMQRLSSSSQPFEYHGTNFGYCAAKKLYYYGFKCHIVSDLRGVPIFIHLTRASISDLYSFEFVIEEMLKLNLIKGPSVYLGDKGYVGEKFQQRIQAQYGITLLSMEHEYKKEQVYGPSPINEFLKPIRKIVETTIDLFSIEFNAGKTKRRTIKGLISSLMAKLTAFNLANFFNYLLDLPLLHVKSFVF